MWRSVFVLCCVAVATAIEQESSNLTPATVRIHHERSTDSEIQATVEAFGETHQLTLKKISMPAVNIQEMYFDNGTIDIVDLPEEQEDAAYFEDEKTGSLFYMNDPNTLEGMLTDSIALKYENDKHVVTEITEKTSKSFCASDELNKLPSDLPKEEEEEEEEEETSAAERRGIAFYVEVTAIMDSYYLRYFGSHKKIIQYLSIYFNMVDRRFRTVSGANVRLRLTGIIISSSARVDSLFMRTRGRALADAIGSINVMSATLARYQRWIKKFDVAHLMTLRDLYISRNGKIQRSVTGIGRLGYPCYRTSRTTYGIGITEDDAFYKGMMTTAHEIAHNLGSPHDPRTNPSRCRWALGYMMSYVRNSYRTFFFSPCSSARIRATYLRRHGSCLKTISNPKSFRLNPRFPGFSMSVTDQCRRFTKQYTAQPNPYWTYYRQCYRLSCRYRYGSGYRYRTSFYPALEGTRCSNTGYCINGMCKSASG